MALAPGTRVGSYEILSAIGAGGMGEVYRARDSRLKRDVAIKVLPDSVARDSGRLARFQREAEVLASLNHPNIAAIYGLEDQALILELVDGETLADVIARGPLPIPEALSIARQICDAFDAAHEQGIVHRDLKPANVKVRRDGSVKVLDFGLAKAIEQAGEAGGAGRAGTQDLTQSPTITSPAMTQAGMILGTAAYMSPEQARGKPVDKRSDIWAFGCVLYEMLTGRRAFEGEDVTETLSRILQREPDLGALPAATPPAIRRLLIRCFEKERNKRLPQIAVASFQIDEALSSPSTVAADSSARARAPRRAALAASALVAGVLLGAAVVWLVSQRGPVLRPPVTRLQMNVSPADEIGGADGRPTRTAFALSPDGRTLVFSAVEKGRRALYARRLDQPTATMIEGTEGGQVPFFSPDGQWVGYWASNQIRKVPLNGGPSVLVFTAGAQLFGASWDDADRIVFARGTGGLLEIPSAGGTPRELTTLNSELAEVGHRLPHALPGGDAVFFTVTKDRFPRWDETEIWVLSRAGGSKRLIEGGADARYVSSGHLLYVREGTLLAVQFDRQKLEIVGGAVGVLPDVMQAAYVAGQPNDTGAMQVSVSMSGTLVYVTGGMQPPTAFDVMQLDRSGQGKPLPIPPQDFRTLRLSPDGQRLALSTVGRDRSTWLFAFDRATFSKLVGAGRSTTPSWTRDGERITFSASTNGPNNVHWIRADGGDRPELLVRSPRNIESGGWMPNGRDLLYYDIPSDAIGAGARGTNVWAQDIAAKSEPRALAGSLGSAGGADASPDGRWVAYHSQEAGGMDVFVDAYPGPGPRYQVSTGGGGSPIWRADGRELFYARSRGEFQRGRGLGSADVDIVAVDVRPGTTLSFGAPRVLFSGRYSMNGPARGWDVSGDGQRFFLLQARARTPDVVNQIHVVQNWAEELK